MKFDILNRWTSKVQFSAEIECGEDEPPNIKTGLSLKWAVSNGANLHGADLSGAVLRGGADLRGADMPSAILCGADLRGADLCGAILHGVDLRAADLRRTILRGAFLTGANMHGTNLSGTFLFNADLRGTDLSNAVLREDYGPDLREYKIDGAFGIIQAGSPNDMAAWGYVETGGTTRVNVDGRHIEINMGRAYWSRPDHPYLANRREVLAALDYIEAVMKLRGWAR